MKLNLRPDEEIGPPGDVYLRRWTLFPRHSWIDRWFNVYLHCMLRDDDDHGLHDHPYDNISIILRGGYMEWSFLAPPREGHEMPQVIGHMCRPGTVIHRRAETAHRLVLPPSRVRCWSLFVHGHRRREWGFWVQGTGIHVVAGDLCVHNTKTIKVARWVHWSKFLEE